MTREHPRDEEDTNSGHRRSDRRDDRGHHHQRPHRQALASATTTATGTSTQTLSQAANHSATQTALSPQQATHTQTIGGRRGQPAFLGASHQVTAVGMEPLEAAVPAQPETPTAPATATSPLVLMSPLPQPPDPETGRLAGKYIDFMLALDPHARRATFSAVKKEVQAEFDKLKGCKRCEFVQFVFDIFDLQEARPLPWILPRSQLMALLSPQSLVNLLQFVWKDEVRIVLSDSLVVEDRLLVSFLKQSLEFLTETHREWEECDKHRGYPGPSELQSTARRLQEREAECNRELQHLADPTAPLPSPGAVSAAGPEHAAAGHAARIVANGTATPTPSPAQQDTPSAAAMAAMEALRSRWGVTSETLEALALLGDRMATLRSPTAVMSPGASPATPQALAPSRAASPPEWGRQEASSSGSVGRWGALLRGQRQRQQDVHQRAVGRRGTLLASSLSNPAMVASISQVLDSQSSSSSESGSDDSATAASPGDEAAAPDGRSESSDTAEATQATVVGDVSTREEAAPATGEGAALSIDGLGRHETLDLGDADGEGTTLLEPPLPSTEGSSDRVAQLHNEIAQVGFRRGRLARACEHGVIMGARRLLALVLTICWRRLIATCQASETRQAISSLLLRPLATSMPMNISSPLGGLTIPLYTSCSIPRLSLTGSSDGEGDGNLGLSLPQPGSGMDPQQVQRCVDTITELQAQLREAKRQLRGAQLREAEAVESGSIALMEAEELRGSLCKAEVRTSEIQNELAKRSGDEDALANLGADELKGLSEELEHTLSTVRAAERVATAEAQTMCAVCWESKKDMAFGCGHQTCCKCGKRLQHCPICRQEIELRIQLF